MSSGPSSSSRGSAFSADVLWGTLNTACAIAGLDDQGAALMRLGENALFHVPTNDVVVRIARSMEYAAYATKEVSVARWLAERRFPAAQLYDLGDIPQPIIADDHPVTFWSFIAGRPGDRRDIATLGEVLRRLHAAAPPSRFKLPPTDILGRVEPRIIAATVPSSDKDFLLQLLAELSSKLPTLPYPLTPTATHGDPHVKNLMIRDDQPILIDLESFSWGQPEWDLAVVATEYRTAKWWTDEEYAVFTDAYGYDVTTWSEGFDIMQAVHELKMSTWLMQNVLESPEIADEYQVRMRTLRGESSPGWRAF